MTLNRRQFFAAGAAVMTTQSSAQDPPRLRRKDCYFGLHFDLHPSASDTALGRDVTDEMVERLLTRVRPDYVQYDCKGHVGYLGYRSKVGPSAPGIVKDSLEIWRRVTARRGVGLYIHFSGVWDGVAVTQHPEWARVRPDGKLDDHNTSTFGPYVDQLMIPELDEAISRYKLDGVWVDGECWSVAPDYGATAARVFREKTGLTALPKTAADQGWLQFLEINRDQFRNYVNHYLQVLHEKHPGVQIASNWLYSSYVPERPELPVDFLSGDFLGGVPISTAHLEARYLAATGEPWDLMAWGFLADRTLNIKIHKSPVQLKQEASAVIPQGGGFEIYYNPTRAGWIDDRLVDVLEDVARFCRERKDISFGTETIPQVAVLFSRHSLYTNTGKLFGGWGSAVNPARGVIDALLAAHYSVDVLPDWKASQASLYPVVIVPDWQDVGPEIRESLAAYARSGGNLVVIGAGNAGAFAKAGAVRDEESWVLGKAGFGSIRGPWAELAAASGQVLESRFPAVDSRRDAQPAAILMNSGKGKMVVIPGPLGAAYAAHHAPALHEFLQRVLARVFRPAVEIAAPPSVEIALRKQGGRRWLLHLSNMTAAQAGTEYAVVEWVPAAGPINVTLRLPRRPAQARWEPEGRELQGTWADGQFQTTIDRLEVHGAVSIEL
jgi:hypothetical protein